PSARARPGASHKAAPRPGSRPRQPPLLATVHRIHGLTEVRTGHRGRDCLGSITVMIIHAKQEGPSPVRPITTNRVTIRGIETAPIYKPVPIRKSLCRSATTGVRNLRI